jgi:hypothetical protein
MVKPAEGAVGCFRTFPRVLQHSPGGSQLEPVEPVPGRPPVTYRSVTIIFISIFPRGESARTVIRYEAVCLGRVTGEQPLR